MSVIYERKSIRVFKKDGVNKTLLEEIVHAAMYSPSAGDMQPWHFIIIDNKDVLKKCNELKGGSKPLDTAPVGILVCGDKDLEKAPTISYADLGAATQNMLLRAKELGLDSCWLSIFPREEVMTGYAKAFKLPANVYPYCLVAIGYGNEQKVREERFKIERIHYNEW